MSIRVRRIKGKLMALCGAESQPEEGDLYLDDGVDFAIRKKIYADLKSEGFKWDWERPELERILDTYDAEMAEKIDEKMRAIFVKEYESTGPDKTRTHCSVCSRPFIDPDGNACEGDCIEPEPCDVCGRGDGTHKALCRRKPERIPLVERFRRLRESMSEEAWQKMPVTQSILEGLEADKAVEPEPCEKCGGSGPEIDRCANCGKHEDQTTSCIPSDDAEWFCSPECEAQHDMLGCPHERANGRHRCPACRPHDDKEEPEVKDG